MDKPKRKRKFNLHVKLSSRTSIFNKKPSHSRQPTDREKAMGGVVAAGLMLLIMTTIMSASIREDQRFLHEGHEAVAQVASCTPQRSKYGPYASVSYTYTLDDQTYSGSTAFDNAQCSAFSEGRSLSAIYLATEPSRSRVIKSEDSPVAQALAYGLVLAGCFFILILALRSLWTELRSPSF